MGDEACSMLIYQKKEKRNKEKTPTPCNACRLKRNTGQKKNVDSVGSSRGSFFLPSSSTSAAQTSRPVPFSYKPHTPFSFPGTSTRKLRRSTDQCNHGKCPSARSGPESESGLLTLR